MYQPALDALSASPSHMCGMSPNPPMRTRPFSNVFFVAAAAGTSGTGTGGTDKAIDLSRARSCRLLNYEREKETDRQTDRGRETMHKTVVAALLTPCVGCGSLEGAWEHV